jgi:hypothetical protein
MDQEYIRSVTQKILDKNTNEIEKKKIRVYHDRLNFACVYCGDSHKNKFAKRGNIYFDRLFYVCFNCEKKTTFDKFAKDFDEMLDPDKKMEIIEHLNNNITYDDYQDDFIDTKFEDLISLKDLEDAFNVRKVSPIYDFVPIVKNGGIYKYLVGRGIPEEKHTNIYQAKYAKGDEGFEHVIILLNRKDDKVLGIQVRNLRQGKRRFFVIYNYETLLEWVNPEIEMDDHQLIVYNKLSYFFNVLNVNLSATVTLFEGYLDSLFYPNSIGVVGVNTDLKFLESNNIDLQYFYDNDKTGNKKSMEKLNGGGSVFLWLKLFDDIVKKKQGKDPYGLHHRISKVKDLNKLAELVPLPYSKLKLYEYFSDDVFDSKWIAKNKWVPKDNVIDYQKKFRENDFD